MLPDCSKPREVCGVNIAWDAEALRRAVSTWVEVEGALRRLSLEFNGGGRRLVPEAPKARSVSIKQQPMLESD